MRKLTLFSILALGFFACGDDTSSNDLAGNPDLTASGDMAKSGDMGNNFPAAPTLGAQIDRIGRAGVNTALTDPFWNDGTQTKLGHHAKQDKYNAASDPTAWATTVLTTGGPTSLALVKGAIAAYDSLNGTSDGIALGDGCGDQLAYGALSNADYTTLATVLVDDQIYVNTSSGSCTSYLAVEANVLGVTNTDCGGRTPNYNTIDITYSALASGALVTGANATCLNGTATCGVSSGVTADPDANVAVPATFPFLGDPN